MVNQIELFWLSETIIAFEKFSFVFSFSFVVLLWCTHHLFFSFAFSHCRSHFLPIAQGVLLHSNCSHGPKTSEMYLCVCMCECACGLWLRVWWENGVRVGKTLNGRWKEPTTKAEIKFNQFAYIFEWDGFTDYISSLRIQTVFVTRNFYLVQVDILLRYEWYVVEPNEWNGNGNEKESDTFQNWQFISISNFPMCNFLRKNLRMNSKQWEI